MWAQDMDGSRQPETLAIIPARGGSKGVPRKNIRPLCGRPLIAWTIDAARAATRLNRIVVSTDDHEIAEIAAHYGADVPFMRPSELSLDDTPDLPVFQHVLAELKEREGYRPEVVVWLRPTAPLRTETDIDEACEILLSEKTDWVRSVCRAEHHPYWMFRVKEGCLTPFMEEINTARYPRRQLLPAVYRLNGAVEVSWCQTVSKATAAYTGRIAPYVMPMERSLDVDTMFDLNVAEFLLTRFPIYNERVSTGL